jgi:hypothetical protein
MNDLTLEAGRGLAQGAAQLDGSVTRSPDSQLFELRTGRRGPTPPSSWAAPCATRPASVSDRS